MKPIERIQATTKAGTFSQTILTAGEVENIYQQIKARLIQECSLIERMTDEEWTEWRKKMVKE